MDLIIIGAGGHGKVVLDIVRAADQYRPIGFIDADASLAETEVGGLPVFGQANLLPKLRSQGTRWAIVAIGDNKARQLYAKHLREQGFDLVNAVHPTAFVSPTASLGVNVVIAPLSAVITESRIGDSAIINTSAVVEHECKIGEAVHIGPGAHVAGRATVLEGAFVGLGANVLQCRSIGRFSMVGAGAVVREDVPDFATVVGVPARIVRVDSPDGIER